MNELPSKPSLKEINAYKNKLNWGEVPTIYRMASSSLSELEGILTHGFDSAFKQILNKELWNLSLLDSYKDSLGELQVKNRPKIALKHRYTEQNYELLCYPIVDGERINHSLLKHPLCPFINWHVESMRMLFRVNGLLGFITFAFQRGDEADMALIKYAHIQIEQLISILNESFDVVDIIGYSLAEFCQEISRRKLTNDVSDLLDTP